MAEDSKNLGLAYFLAGLGIGALDGVLYAPKSGRETRDDIVSGAREGSEYLRTRSREVADRAGDLVDKGKERVSDYVDQGRHAVDRGREQWDEFVERGKNMVTDQKTRVTAAVDAGRHAYSASASDTSTEAEPEAPAEN